MEANQGYCVKCRKPQEMRDTSLTWANPRQISAARRGRCATCGTGMFKILPKVEQEEAKAELRRQEQSPIAS
jgi:hypothetical protein